MSHEGGSSRREKLNINTVEEFWKALHPDDLEHVRENFREHLKGEMPYFEAMYRVKGEDDQWIWALSKGRAKEYDSQGLPVTVAGATKDITLLKQTEEVLRGLNEELESRVEERTDDLQSANESLKQTLQELRATQDQLVEAEKMASLGGLVAGVAHEINTPLGVAVTASSHLEKEVRKLVNLLDEENLDREGAIAHCVQQLQNTQFVLKNLRRAAELVRSFKQVAVDQSTEDQRQFNLNDYLREVLVSLRPKFKHTDHVVNVECPENLVLNSFPGAIYQTVTNLVMNSLVHGFVDVNQGHIDIEVREHDDQAIIQYRDNGCGFGPDIESRIFEPFFTTRRGKGGSGLGMHIVFNLVTQVLGGTIVCKGKPGEGVEVTISLPIQL
jgi:C4-dicarboxylate-specific signal transduction histidine kinase